MHVRFISGAIVDAGTTAKAGDTLDIPEVLARALVAQRIAVSTEPVLVVPPDTALAELVDSDGTLSANSDAKLPTQKAVKAYIDAAAAAAPAAPDTPDTPPLSPNAMDDEFTGTVLNAKWTKRNFANTAAAVPSVNPLDSKTGRLRFTCRNDGRTWALITQPISGAFSVATKVWQQGSRNDFDTCGLVVMNSVSGKFSNFGPFCELSGSGGGIEVQEWTDVDNFSSDAYADHEGAICAPLYLKIASDGTTLTFSMSLDGILYSPVYTEPVATFLGSVTAIGLSTWGPTQPAPNGVATFDAIFQWFRRLS